jgi:hypothetical protein
MKLRDDSRKSASELLESLLLCRPFLLPLPVFQASEFFVSLRGSKMLTGCELTDLTIKSGPHPCGEVLSTLTLPRGRSGELQMAPVTHLPNNRYTTYFKIS